MLNRKRPLLTRNEVCAKKCFTLLDGYREISCSGGGDHHGTLGTDCCGLDFTHEASNPAHYKSFVEQLSLWSDTRRSVDRVREQHKEEPSEGVSLDVQTNEKFLEFHRVMTEECGAEAKQHSWAVMEKQEEVVMYGPYFPDYSKGVHTEDVVVRQTEELLEAGDLSSDWKLYIFSINSPCLARKEDDPCMINLVRKAQEWWSVYGVKTHIGFVRCWGFKGSKETLFRDVDYSQVDAIKQTENRDDFIRAAVTPLSEDVRCAVKRLLASEDLGFSLSGVVQEQDWKSYFKRLHEICEAKPEDEDKDLADAIIDAAHRLLKRGGSVDELLEIGNSFLIDQFLGSDASGAFCGDASAAFQQCWSEMVREKYVELVRARLTEDFNRRVIRLFVRDIISFTHDFLHIGQIRFSKEESKLTT